MSASPTSRCPPSSAPPPLSPSQLLWVVSGYKVALGPVPALAGRLGDDHGRRFMFQIRPPGSPLHQAGDDQIDAVGEKPARMLR